jgi:hypothetical protein
LDDAKLRDLMGEGVLRKHVQPGAWRICLTVWIPREHEVGPRRDVESCQVPGGDLGDVARLGGSDLDLDRPGDRARHPDLERSQQGAEKDAAANHLLTG